MASDQEDLNRKRPFANDDTNGNGVQLPKRKNRRTLRDGDVGSERKVVANGPSAGKNAPFPFLPCHLTMLKALYRRESRTTPGGTQVEDEVEQHLWDSAHLFLRKRDFLLQCKERSFRLHGIHDEAKTVLDLSTQSKKGAIPAFPNGNDRDSKGNIFASRYRYPVQTQQQGGPNKKMGLFSPQLTQGFSATSPEFFHLRTSEERDHPEARSWALMTLLLGRKCSAATDTARHLAKEFLPLISAADNKLRQLRAIMDVLVGARVEEMQNKMLGMDCHDRLSSAHLCHEEKSQMEKIVEIESKIRLWGLLSASLKESVDV